MRMRMCMRMCMCLRMRMRMRLYRRNNKQSIRNVENYIYCANFKSAR